VGIQYLDRPERPPGLSTTRADEGPVYGTQLSVNASTTSGIWGTKNAGINYAPLVTAWGVAGIIGPRIRGVPGLFPFTAPPFSSA
jgi:hypothetical protein